MTNGIVVNIQGEDINKMIAQAILDSTLGKHINEAVGKVIGSMGNPPYGRENDVLAAVREVVYMQIRKVLQEQYGDLIRERIIEAVEQEFAPERDLVGKVIRNMLDGKYKDY